jgi:hypothetical protein
MQPCCCRAGKCRRRRLVLADDQGQTISNAARAGCGGRRRFSLGQTGGLAELRESFPECDFAGVERHFAIVQWHAIAFHVHPETKLLPQIGDGVQYQHVLVDEPNFGTGEQGSHREAGFDPFDHQDGPALQLQVAVFRGLKEGRQGGLALGLQGLHGGDALGKLGTGKLRDQAIDIVGRRRRLCEHRANAQ